MIRFSYNLSLHSAESWVICHGDIIGNPNKLNWSHIYPCFRSSTQIYIYWTFSTLLYFKLQIKIVVYSFYTKSFEGIICWNTSCHINNLRQPCDAVWIRLINSYISFRWRRSWLKYSINSTGIYFSNNQISNFYFFDHIGIVSRY